VKRGQRAILKSSAVMRRTIGMKETLQLPDATVYETEVGRLTMTWVQRKQVPHINARESFRGLLWSHQSPTDGKWYSCTPLSPIVLSSIWREVVIEGVLRDSEVI